MKSGIVNYLREHKGASFIELQEHVPGFKGNNTVGVLDKNVIFWTGVSPEATKALDELLTDKVIELIHIGPLVYFIDGAVMKLPIAKRIEKYKTRHWIPVVMSLRRRD